MKQYYITSNGILSKKDQSLLFKNQDGETELPLADIESLIITGNVTFTKPIITLLAQSKVPVFILSRGGNYITSILPENYLLSGHVKILQAKSYLDINRRMELARSFVLGAARNYYITLKRHQAPRIRINKNDIMSARDIQTLMGIEGNIADEYFESLDSILPEIFKIGKRTRRPPLSYGNSLISFVNSIIYATVSSEIFSTHLDPAISFLHEPSTARTSLALDISEIFKPIFGHSSIISLIRRKELDPDKHFIDNSGIFLNEAGKRKVIGAVDDMLQRTVYSKNLGRYITNKHIIRLELYKLERFLLDGEKYKPYVARR